MSGNSANNPAEATNNANPVGSNAMNVIGGNAASQNGGENLSNTQTGENTSRLTQNVQAAAGNQQGAGGFQFILEGLDNRPSTSAQAMQPLPEVVWNYLATAEKYGGKPEWHQCRGQVMYEIGMIGNLSAENRKATLLLKLSRDLYSKVMNYVQKQPEILTFDEVDQALHALCNEAFSPWVEVRRFRCAKMEESESVDSFFHRLKSISLRCDFSNAPEQVRDQLIVGVTQPIFNKAMELPRNVELTRALTTLRAQEFKMKTRTGSTEQVNAVNEKSVHHRLGVPPRKSSRKERNDDKTDKECWRCGKKGHEAVDCRFHDAVCHKCKKVGHISATCHSKKKTGKVNKLQESRGKVSESDPIQIPLKVDGQEILFELDSGSRYTILSRRTFERFFEPIPLEPVNDILLVTYTAGECHILGGFHSKVEFNGKIRKMRFLVADKGTGDLLGRNFLPTFGLKIQVVGNVAQIVAEESLNELAQRLLAEFPDVVTSRMGKHTGDPVSLQTKDELRPKFLKAREIPYAYKAEVERLLAEMEADGILEKVNYCEYGTPLVVVPKTNGKLRICGDYKSTINCFLKDFNHPSPSVENIFNSLGGFEYFFVIDIRDAYHQLVLTEESARLCAWNTHIGTFLVRRMPQGIRPASSIFQSVIEKYLNGIEGVEAFIDDIVGGGRNPDETAEKARKVFQALRLAGFTVRPEKCKLFRRRVKVLGHVIDATGISKEQDKLDQIGKVRPPKNVKEVQAFCGLINYYAKFVPRLGELMKPLYELLRKGIKFDWTLKCEQAFMAVKQAMSADLILAHYDPKRPTILETDASDHTISAVLLQETPVGERPIMYWAKSLDTTQRNYSVVDKEALAVVRACKKFSKYLLGMKFKIRTDQKALIRIFSDEKGLPVTASSRLLRWAVYLSGFDYVIEHVRTDKNKADPLSRLRHAGDPRQSKPTKSKPEALNAIRDNGVPMNFEDVKAETNVDTKLSYVKKCLKTKHMEALNSDDFIHYYRRRNELSSEKGVIMWGRRLVVPSRLRKYVLAELHSGHMGTTKMKSKARMHFWWPNMDDDVMTISNTCEDCRSVRPSPEKAPLTPWPQTQKPWERVHTDYLGPLFGFHFLIVIDSETKWLEAFRTAGPTTAATIQCLRQCFARFGLSRSLISDNGTCFTSAEFSQFLRANGIYHSRTAPGHPASNGAAENAVGTVKKFLLKAFRQKHPSADEIDKALQNFLFEYRNTVHCTTGLSPAKAMLGRSLRDTLSQILPHRARKALKENKLRSKNVARQVKNHGGRREVEFEKGSRAMIRDYRDPNKPGWVEATIKEKLSHRTYQCELSSGRLIKRHIRQIQSPALPPLESVKARSTYTSSVSPSSGERREVRGRAINTQSCQSQPMKVQEPEPTVTTYDPDYQNPVIQNEHRSGRTLPASPDSNEEFFDCSEVPNSNERLLSPVLRRSSRISKPPKRLGFD